MKKVYTKAAVFLTAAILPVATLTSCSIQYYDYFAEIIVSDNSSVLADNSFSQTTFKGYSDFMAEKTVTIPGQEQSYTKDSFILPKAGEIQQATGIWRRPGPYPNDRTVTFRGAFASGKKTLIVPGFNHENSLKAVATDPDYKDKGIIWLDGFIGDNSLDLTNVSSFSFRAEESAFLTGIAVSVFLNLNSEIFKENDGKLTVAAFVGVPIPTTLDFVAGLQAGIFAFNESLCANQNNQNTNANPDNSSKNWKPINFISINSNVSAWASGSFGVGEGTKIAKQLLDVDFNADVIMPVAGPQTLDVVNVIRDSGKKAIVLGVDSAQETQTINNKLPTVSNLKGFTKIEEVTDVNATPIDIGNNIIQFSAIKKLDSALKQVLESVFNNIDPNNQNNIDKSAIKGFGYQNIGKIQNKTVGVSEAGLPYVKLFAPSWFDNNNELKPDVVAKNNLWIWMKAKDNNFVRFNNSWRDQYKQGDYETKWNKMDKANYNPDSPSTTIKIYKDGSTPLNGSKWDYRI